MKPAFVVLLKIHLIYSLLEVYKEVIKLDVILFLQVLFTICLHYVYLLASLITIIVGFFISTVFLELLLFSLAIPFYEIIESLSFVLELPQKFTVVSKYRGHG